MFNQGDNRGFDLINHAIRMGTVGEVLRRNDLLRQLNEANAALLGRAAPPSSSQATIQPQLAQSQQANPATRRFSHGSVVPSDRVNPNAAFQFPWKLHDMLDNASVDGFEYIVSWSEDGLSFRVHKPPKFVESVMPIYFKQTKYKSFQRQLNLYGFTRISEGPNKGGYRHNYFVRGQRALCQLISRSSSTGESNETQEATTASAILGAQSLPTSTPDGKVGSSSSTKMASVPLSSTTKNASASSPMDIARGTADDGESQGTSEGSNSDSATLPATPHNLQRKLPPTSAESVGSSKTNGDYYKELVHKEYQFPWKLYEMLEKSSTNSFEDIVSWQPGDTCFKVHNTIQFVHGVMPRFFKQTKYKSFQRQLNLYGFTRIEEGPNRGGYRHQFFIRGRKDLLSSMRRQKIKGEKPKATPSVGEQERKLSPSEASKKGTGAKEHDEPLVVPPHSGIDAILAAIQRDSMRQEGNPSGNTINEKLAQDTTNMSSQTKPPSKVSTDRLSWRQDPSESFSDWTIEVVNSDSGQKDTYNVHRRVIAVGPRRSERFAELFKLNGSTNVSQIRLGSIEASVFPLILDHIYENVLPDLDANRACALYRLAEYLEMPSVLLTVTEYFTKNMTKETIVDFIDLAKCFSNQALLRAAIQKCAEELHSVDAIFATKIDPETLLQILQRGRGIPANSAYFASYRPGQLISLCFDTSGNNLSIDLFEKLTDREILKSIDGETAIRLLGTKTQLTSTEQSASISIHLSMDLDSRCIASITRDWTRIKTKVEKSDELSKKLKSIPSHLLYEILMHVPDS